MEAKELKSRQEALRNRWEAVLTDIVDNYCYYSLFKKPLREGDKPVNHLQRLVVALRITTKKTKYSGISKMHSGVEVSFYTKKELVGEELKRVLSIKYLKLKKNFLKIYAGGFYHIKRETAEWRAEYDVAARESFGNKKITPSKKKELLAFYDGELRAELEYRWGANGFRIERRDKNYLYLKAPILNIELVEVKDPEYRNIKEILNT